jgi:hypothetical protein
VTRSVYDEIEFRVAEARCTLRETERQRRVSARLRAELASLSASVALIKLQRAIARKYRPDQPRVPAGRPGAGEWTRDGGSGSGWRRATDCRAIQSTCGRRRRAAAIRSEIT